MDITDDDDDGIIYCVAVDFVAMAIRRAIVRVERIVIGLDILAFDAQSFNGFIDLFSGPSIVVLCFASISGL